MKCPAVRSGKCSHKMCDHAQTCQKIEEFRYHRHTLNAEDLTKLGMPMHDAKFIMDKLEVYRYKIVQDNLW